MDNKVLFNENTFYMKYTAYVSDPSKFSVGFAIALAAEIAGTIAFAVTNSMTVAEAAQKQAAEQLRVGKSMDAQEGGTPDEIVEEDPVEVRS